jgi:hypothetical protein
MSEDDVNQRLDEMTGDPAVTRQLRASLEKLRDGGSSPALAEMAREVLEGRTTLREVASSSAYATEMGKVMADFQEWNSGLTDEEREKLAAEAVEADEPARREYEV